MQPAHGAMKIAARSLLGKYMNLRKEVRFPLDSKTFMTTLPDGSTSKISVLDLSESGISFVMNCNDVQVGDVIQVQIAGPADENGVVATYEAQLISQYMIYPQGTEDLEHAIYRYSARLHQKIETAKLHAMVRD